MFLSNLYDMFLGLGFIDYRTKIHIYFTIAFLLIWGKEDHIFGETFAFIPSSFPRSTNLQFPDLLYAVGVVSVLARLAAQRVL